MSSQGKHQKFCLKRGLSPERALRSFWGNPSRRQGASGGKFPLSEAGFREFERTKPQDGSETAYSEHRRYPSDP
jgi:hypothetical protein